MADPKKQDLVGALAMLDSIAEQVVEHLRPPDGSRYPIADALDAARFWPEPVRLAVNAYRKEHGDATDEALTHEAARRISAEFGSGDRWDASWEVKGWEEVERLETGERLFEVRMLGIDLPADGEELIPIKRRGADLDQPSPTDFCNCAHTRGSHQPNDGECDLCGCKEFRLLGPGMSKLNVEELPTDPHPTLTIPDVENEDDAITFLRQLVGEAGSCEPGPEEWMALQRLLAKGWRIVQPKDSSD